MRHRSNSYGGHNIVDTRWANGWAVVADPVKFAARFNLTVSGAYRYVTCDDIRQMEQCGLIGRSGFFDRSDLETVRGILQYEQLRQEAARKEIETELAEIMPV